MEYFWFSRTLRSQSVTLLTVTVIVNVALFADGLPAVGNDSLSEFLQESNFSGQVPVALYVIQEKVSQLDLEEKDGDKPRVVEYDNPTWENVKRVRRPDDVKIIGMSIDYESDKRRVTYDERGSPNVLEGMEVKITLYGQFKRNTYFRFSKFHLCDDPKNEEATYPVFIQDDDQTVGIVHVKLPLAGDELNEVYACLKTDGDQYFRRQGESKTGLFGLPIKPWLLIKLTKSMFPVYLHIFLIVMLLSLSGLFSGLNLGLMSLDKTDLKIIENTGSPEERKYAGSIAPVRNHGNFLLCCLLFSNVLVNATLTIFVDDLTSGLIAIAASTLAIVIFGEIIPQAICSRHGLAVGARTIYITKFFMLITSPLAYPLSLLLDKVLGEELGNVYTRERLKELLEVTRENNGLEPEEVGMISGALDLKLKTVQDIMVSLDKIFMLPADGILDFETLEKIEREGFTRIPVYEGERSNVIAMINVKQLTMLDTTNMPIRRYMDYYKMSLFFVFENTHLDFMFKVFCQGCHGHMAFVQRVCNDGPGDPTYETVGLLTMEDVIEEILQTDIRDEQDIEKINAQAGNPRRPSAIPFKFKKRPRKVVEIPSSLILAATQYLSNSVEPFTDGVISTHIIQRLLKTTVQFVKAPKRKGRQKAPDVFLYESGKAADCFIMILEGRVSVTAGKEKLMYETGPFTTFGKDFLLDDSFKEPPVQLKSVKTAESTLSKVGDQDSKKVPSETQIPKRRRPTFIPDYTVKVVTDVYCLRVTYGLYRHAITATKLEEDYSKDPTKIGDDGCEWQDEVEKVLDMDGDDEYEGGDLQDDTKPFKDALDKNLNVLTDRALENETKSLSTATDTDDSDNENSKDDDSNPADVTTKLLQNSKTHTTASNS